MRRHERNRSTDDSAPGLGLGVLTALAVLAALLALVPTTPASAATTYVWVQGYDSNGDTVPGADHVSWSNAANWSPQGVPGAGDTVVLTNAPAYHGNVQSNTTLTVPGDLTVDGVVMSAPRAGSVHLAGAPLTVTGQFSWTGGEIETPVTLDTSATGTVGAGQLKVLRHRLTVRGSLRLDDIGTDTDRGLDLYPDYGGDDDGIAIAAGGVLSTAGTNLISGTGCCTDPARIRSAGTIHVESGTTTFRAVELDLRGTARIDNGARLHHTVGSARLGENAHYTGGGTLDLTDTASVRARPDHEPVPGGILMEGIGQLADETRIHLGIGAKLTGVGGFVGVGTIDVSAPANTGDQSAHLYGDLTIGPATKLHLAGAVPSRLESWSPDLDGYHGVLRISGSAELAARTSFVTQAGTHTQVTKGGTLRLGNGSTWGNGDCCLDPARLDIAAGATLAVGSGRATLVRVALRALGTTAVPSGGRLVAQGLPIRLGGSLRVAGPIRPGAEPTVITASRLKGRFACVQPAGQVAIYTTTTVKVTGVLGAYSGCATTARTKVATTTVAKHSTVRIKATKGVPKKAGRVLLAVTVTKVGKASRIKVGGAPAFRAAKGRRTTRYVVAKRRKHAFVTVRNGGGGAVRITVVLLGSG